MDHILLVTTYTANTGLFVAQSVLKYQSTISRDRACEVLYKSNSELGRKFHYEYVCL